MLFDDMITGCHGFLHSPGRTRKEDRVDIFPARFSLSSIITRGLSGEVVSELSSHEEGRRFEPGQRRATSHPADGMDTRPLLIERRPGVMLNTSPSIVPIGQDKYEH